MTNRTLALEGVSFVLPDGRALFSDLHERFDQQPTALVGRNGIGKSVLARLLAGELQPSAGRCLRTGSVRLLAQQPSHPAGATVAALAGVQPALDALARIEAGGTDPADFEAVGDRWDLRQRLQQALHRHRLGHLDAGTPASALSGGEAMRVALAGALLSDADFLILDEPSNHLDLAGRQALAEQLRCWPRGLLVISHDRQLLAGMARTVELSSLGLRSYGGGYAFYALCKAHERQHAQEQLERCKLQRDRAEQSLREQQQRQERRLARGRREAGAANQAKVLLGQQKARSEGSAGRLRRRHAAAREQLSQRVREAWQQVEADRPIALRAPAAARAAPRAVVELAALVLPFVAGPTRRLDLMLSGRQRVAVLGPNGCGKSTLLRVMAGALRPVAGTCRVPAATCHLDQDLAGLDLRRPVLNQLLAANRRIAPAEARTQLAQLGLDADRATAPCAALSGGERMKAALACALHADPPPQLLLLDEPSNHLDLPSVQALELMLRGYPGALVVVSHDAAFLDGVDLTDRLVATGEGWRLEAAV